MAVSSDVVDCKVCSGSGGIRAMASRGRGLPRLPPVLLMWAEGWHLHEIAKLVNAALSARSQKRCFDLRRWRTPGLCRERTHKIVVNVIMTG